MRVIGNNPDADNAEITAVASGTLPSGETVIVNADGTVSVAGLATLTQGVGSAVVYESANSQYNVAVYDTSNDKVIVAYADQANSSRGTAIVGTVSGQSISFGSPAEIGTGNSVGALNAAFDVNAGAVIFTFEDNSNTGYGTAVVGTVSGTSFTFGSKTVFRSGSSDATAIAYDENAQKCVIVYRDKATSGRPGKAKVATISGTSVSFGSEANISSDNNNAGVEAITYDANAQKVVAIWTNYSSGSRGCASVGTISGTSISFGSQVTFESGSTTAQEIVYDASAQKVLIAYKDNGDSNKGKCVVGTVSGTNISFGSIVEFDASELTLRGISLAYDTNASKIVLSYEETGTSPNSGKNLPVTISGTTPSLGTATNFSTLDTQHVGSVYDPDQKKVVVVYASEGGDDSYHGTANVFQNATEETNITAENFIGFSSGSVAVNSVTQALGSAVVFESAAVSSNVASTFDSNLNKVVIVYQDTGNSFYGTAIVGTLSGTSISFGTPVVFSSANRTQEIQITFDSNSNKVVIAYDDKADGQKGKAVVGTVSGTGISFGSIVTFNNGSTNMGTPNAITFDSSSNKVVIAFQDKADSNKGKAIVGTVSDTSISFGSEATFLNANYANQIAATFDSNSNKVVIVYKDGSNSTHGYAVVGTVSSTSISFGTPVVFESAETNNPNVAFDTVNNKIVIAYADGTVGTAIVGTVSGTAISFGSPVIFNSTATTSPRVRFDATANKIVIAYGEGSGNAGTFKTGTVSGTSISFGSATVFESGSTNGQNGLVYDSNAGKMVLSYYSGSNSGYGTSKVLQTGHTAITRAEVASGSNAVIDIGSAISTNQLSLTAGQQYFVQTDGTLGLTAADPSVIAGTAISATEIIVKG